MTTPDGFSVLVATWHQPGGPLDGVCVGRAHLPRSACPSGIGGPTVVAFRRDGVFDLSAFGGTMSDFLDRPDRLDVARRSELPRLATLEAAVAESGFDRRSTEAVHLLTPFDLQVVKACGVTFIGSLLERVVEEKAGGDVGRSREIRATLEQLVGSTMSAIEPGSAQAAEVKQRLIAAGLWSQYLEVGIGPDAEIFTKAPVLSSVGFGERVGLRRESTWNNLEPEVVLAVNGRNEMVGAGLGNDLTLRDFEGRSALLLGEAKDANASSSMGPWIRLFDPARDFTVATLLDSEVRFTIEGEDGFSLSGANALAEISRSPEDLVHQTGGHAHQYPDGYALYLGATAVPTADRSVAGLGFHHQVGDRMEISNPHLGALVNWIELADVLPPWTAGIRSLATNLSSRGLIDSVGGSA